MSLDGKISTGDVDERDVDLDYPKIKGVREGLYQYYDLEKRLGTVYFNSGRVMAKVGFNDREWHKEKKDNLDFILVDSKPHLTVRGCEYFAKRAERLFIVTTNKSHPVYKLVNIFQNIRIFQYDNKIDFQDFFKKLKEKHGINNMIIQSGGDLNSVLLRERLVDQVLIVLAPLLIGGKNTQTLVGGDSLHSFEDLQKIAVLKLKEVKELKDSYITLKYEVLPETVVET